MSIQPDIRFESSLPLSTPKKIATYSVVCVVALAVIAVGAAAYTYLSGGAWACVGAGSLALMVGLVKLYQQGKRYLLMREHIDLIQGNYPELLNAPQEKAYLMIPTGPLSLVPPPVIVLIKNERECRLAYVQSHYDTLQEELQTHNYQMVMFKDRTVLNAPTAAANLVRNRTEEYDTNCPKKIYPETALEVVEAHHVPIQKKFQSLFTGDYYSATGQMEYSGKITLLEQEEKTFLLIYKEGIQEIHYHPNKSEAMEKFNELLKEDENLIYYP